VKSNPYDSLPVVPSFIVVHARDVDALPLPYLSFVLMEHTLGRGTLIATAATP